ncbi:MAG: hypothetical protein IPM57_03595 [Oligoflexia bacterium]|nr:hypothetical protein [Oligoflexia bacterium]
MILALLFSLSLTAQSQPRFVNPVNPGIIEITKPELYSRVLSIGDVNGNYAQLYNLLVSTQIISPEGKWLGAKSLLIFTGNLIGSGPQNIAVIDLMLTLMLQAETAGGRIIVLLGSEELSLLAKPGKYKNPALERELAERKLRLEHLISPYYPRGAFLRSLPIALKVGTWLFTHTGNYPPVLWDQFKVTAAQLLYRGYYDHELLIGPDSIFSNKFWWKNTEDKNAILQRLNANGFFGMVFGGQNETFNSPGEIGTSDAYRLIKVTVGTVPWKILAFLTPAQMKELVPPKIISISTGFIIKPLN